MTKTEAIAAFGSIKGVADALGITIGAVMQWDDIIPPLRVFQIDALLAERGE